MRAAFTPIYGSADVVEVREIPTPTPGEHEVLVEVPLPARSQRRE